MGFWINRSHGRIGDDPPNSTLRTSANAFKAYCSSIFSATHLLLLRLYNRFSFTTTQQNPQTQTDPPLISVTTVEFPQSPYPAAPPPPMEITEPVSSVAPLIRSPPIMPIQAQLVGDFISIPMDESHPLNRSTSWRYTRVVSFSSSSQSDLPYNLHVSEEIENSNPTVSELEKNEFGKMMLNIAVPMITCLIAIRNPGSSPLFIRLVAVALSLGFAATWNGVLLRKFFPRIANYIEQLGVVSILVAFFGMIGSLLPVKFIWVPWLSCGLSLVPFILPIFR